MAIAQKLAGYTLGAADLLRRAMGKKKKEILDKEYVPFSDGMRANGYSDAAIKTLWDILVPFSDYAFNKAHSAAYGAGLLLDRLPQGQLPGRVHGGACSPASATTRTSRRSTSPSAAAWASRCCRPTSTRRSPGSPRSARTSGSAWPRCATSAPTWSSRSCATARRRAPYTDFYDFLRKVDAVACNKKTVESLIKAGAFDSLGHTPQGPARRARRRDRLVPRHQAQRGRRPVRPVRRRVRRRPSPAPPAWWSRRRSRPPSGTSPTCWPSSGRCSGSTSPTIRCSALEHVLAKAADMSIAALAEEGTVADGQVVNLAGILSGVQRRITKQGRAWASATLEDLDGAVEVLFFPNTYELVGQYIAEDAIVVVKGRVDRRDDQPRLMAMDLSIPDITSADDVQAGRAGAAAVALHPAAGRAAQGGAGQPPGQRPRCTSSWSTARARRCCGSARCGWRRRPR